MTRRSKVATSALAALAGLAAWIAGTAAPAASGEKPADLAKQTTIMSRILEKKLSEALAGDVLTADIFRRGVQGFYVPSIGALFFIDVRFPLAQPPGRETRPGDLWDRFEREIEGKPPVLLGVRPRLDPQKIERLKTTIFDVLAQYGKRLEAVGDEERIVIIASHDGGTVFSFSRTGETVVVSSKGDGNAAAAYAIVLSSRGSEDSKPAARDEADSSKARTIARSHSGDSARQARQSEIHKEAVGKVVISADTPQKVVAVSTPQKVSIVGPTMTTWKKESVRSALVIVVAKKDLVADPAELAKKAVIQSYAY